MCTVFHRLQATNIPIDGSCNNFGLQKCNYCCLDATGQNQSDGRTSELHGKRCVEQTAQLPEKQTAFCLKEEQLEDYEDTVRCCDKKGSLALILRDVGLFIKNKLEVRR